MLSFQYSLPRLYKPLSEETVVSSDFLLILNVGLYSYNKKKKERTCFSFLSISDGGISAWGMYRRNLRWRKESKGG